MFRARTTFGVFIFSAEKYLEQLIPGNWYFLIAGWRNSSQGIQLINLMLYLADHLPYKSHNSVTVSPETELKTHILKLKLPATTATVSNRTTSYSIKNVINYVHEMSSLVRLSYIKSVS